MVPHCSIILGIALLQVKEMQGIVVLEAISWPPKKSPVGLLHSVRPVPTACAHGLAQTGQKKVLRSTAWPRHTPKLPPMRKSKGGVFQLSKQMRRQEVCVVGRPRREHPLPHLPLNESLETGTGNRELAPGSQSFVVIQEQKSLGRRGQVSLSTDTTLGGGRRW